MINTRLRFSVLHRDRFTCRYCGVRATHRKLEVDHIVPVSKGGRNDPANLVTACSVCNNGKSNMMLEHLPSSADILFEQAERCIPAYHPSPMDAEVATGTRESARLQGYPAKPFEHESPTSAEAMAMEAIYTVFGLGLLQHLGIPDDDQTHLWIDTPLPVRLIETVTTEILAWTSAHLLDTGDVTDIVWAALDTTIYLLGTNSFPGIEWAEFEQTMISAIGAVFSGAATAWVNGRWERYERYDREEPPVHQVDAVDGRTGAVHRLPARSVKDFLGYARVRIL